MNGSLLLGLLVTLAIAQSALPRKDIPAIAKAANGAIVSIVMSDKDGRPIAQGSGFLVSKDGIIVTNYHVISEGSSAIVKFPDGAFYVVDGVLASDKARDVAVIKAHGGNFRILTLGNSDQLQVGEEVVAIGNPLSLESTVSNGIVSGIRTVDEEGGQYLQITAPISPGSSGGPLFNMAGEVIGITTMYLKGGENLNFAIPINDAKPLLSADSKVKPFRAVGEVKSETPVDVASSASPSTARDYYTQLYDAGGFLPFEYGRSYVCFSDDPAAQSFFTFSVLAYDKVWGKSKLDVILVHEFLLPSYDAVPGEGTEAYLRIGGALLEYTDYDKGVEVGLVHYRYAFGNSWTLRDYNPSEPFVKAPETLLLEPATLRYIGRFANGQTPSLAPSGACQKITTRHPH